MAVELSLSKIVPFAASGDLSVASNGEVLLVWNNTTVWRSVDAEVWAPVLSFSTSQDFERSLVFWLNPTTAVALSYEGGNYTSRTSTDGGLTWGVFYSSATSYFSGPVLTSTLYASQFHAANGYVYISSSDGSVFRSSDLSAWQATNLTGTVQGVAFGNGVWLLAIDGTHYRSTDGVTFSVAYANSHEHVYARGNNACWSDELSKFFIWVTDPDSVASSADAVVWDVHSDAGGWLWWQSWGLTAIVPISGGVVVLGSTYGSGDGWQSTNLYNAAENAFYDIRYGGGGGGGGDSEGPSMVGIDAYSVAPFGPDVLFAGKMNLYDPATETDIDSGGEYTALLSAGPPPPVVVPEFWTGFSLSYEIP